MSHTTTNLVLSGLAISFVAITFYHQRSRKQPLPPGPPSLPLIGNIHKFPTKNEWLYLTELKEQFGDVMMLHGLGNHVLVLSSVKHIRELFETRYSIYSDRPRLVMVGELAGGSDALPALCYGSRWRDQRKLAHVALSAGAVSRHNSLIEEAAQKLCGNITNDPNNFFAHIKLATGGHIILSLTYGIEVESATNEFMVMAEEAMDFATANMTPGKNLCDMFPWMVYLPSWLPFQQLGRHGRRLLYRLRDMPFEYVKRNMVAGTASPSLTQFLLEEYQGSMTPEWEDLIRSCVGSMYGAGTDSMYASILVIIHAMLLYPEKQSKAQAEIDAVIGLHRMPLLSDMDRLPYVNALIKEAMRWHPIHPLGLPRCLKEEDTYAGYHLPKGTIIIPNAWAISREPNLKYPPEDFIPERFLDPSQSVIDPATWAFGFGRRVCPGKLLAENTMFIMVASILASFTVEPIPDSPIAPSFEPSGLTSPPRPFACAFKPRHRID